MDKREFAMFAAAMRTYYPKEQLFPNAQAMDLWFREVRDIPFPIAELALRKWVATSKWSPTISELRSKITSIHWEAYEIVASYNRKALLSEEDKKKYQWIYENTKQYRYEKSLEPSVSQLLHDSGLRIGNGDGALQIGSGGE